jgi:hypothetical protein
MRPKGLIIIAMAIIFYGVTCHAQDSRPQVPFIQLGICPSEGCQFGTKGMARSSLKAYKKEGDTTAIAFTIKAGEKFTAIGGNVHVVQLGKLVLEKSFDNYVKGDTVYILSYEGEGAYDLWYKGKVLSANYNNLDRVWENGKVLNWPICVWWVWVENKSGKQGWLKVENICDNDSKMSEKIEWEYQN